MTWPGSCERVNVCPESDVTAVVSGQIFSTVARWKEFQKDGDARYPHKFSHSHRAVSCITDGRLANSHTAKFDLC